MRSWSTPPVPHLVGGGAPIRIFDTSRDAIIALTPDTATARLYVCGITPYDATHLGHAATYVTFDLIGRLWRDAGHEVVYVQNITDVDEPLLERADRDGVAWQDLAAREIELFREDMTALRVIPPEHYIGAVEGIPDDVAAVTKLLADGVAYRVPVELDSSDDETGQTPQSSESAGCDVYLDIAKVPSFGTVSNWDRGAMFQVFAERGGDPDRRGKRDPLDPLLWRAHRIGEPSWEGGELGRGRPGWHIECTTIALRYLGPTFDVQGGGTDLIFPHHEMSAAQGAALTDGRPFASTYVHQAMVGLDGAKMSKSQGNLVLVSRLRADGVDPMAIRLLLLAQHYRTPWDYTDTLLDEAIARGNRWSVALSDRTVGHGAGDGEVEALIGQVRAALLNDLDSPAALRIVEGSLGAAAAWTPEQRDALGAALDALLGIAW